MKYQLVQLQDIIEFPPKVALKRGGNYPFIEMGDINSDSRYVRNQTQKQYTSSGSSKFTDKDILFARITPCLENGKIAQAILPQGKMGFGSTEFFVFRAKPDKMDQTFLYYLSKSDLLWKSAVNSMVGASGRQRADATFLKRLKFYIPAIGDQKKIAAILSAYDDLIENNNRRIAILEKMAEEIYKEWFVRMRFPGYEKAEFEKGIPKEWKIKKIGHICFVGRGSSPRPINDKAYFENGSIPWIK
nr:hypothetical protein [Desulfobacula sp.]